MNRVRSHFLSGPSKSLSIHIWNVSEEDIRSDSRVVVDDLPGLSVSCHSSLWCSSICAHLQANDASPFSQFFLCEFPPVLLSLPVENKTTNKQRKEILSSLFFMAGQKNAVNCSSEAFIKIFVELVWNSQREASNSLQMVQKSHAQNAVQWLIIGWVNRQILASFLNGPHEWIILMLFLVWGT